MDQKELEAIAYHEAGHVVVGHYLDYPLKRVTIRPEGNMLGHAMHGGRMKAYCDDNSKPSLKRVHRMRWEERALILLGGPLAEERFRGRRESTNAEGDYNEVWEIMNRYGDDQQVREAWFAYLEERARSIIWRDWKAWPQIEAIAAGLLQHKTLSEGEIRQILESVEGNKDATA